MSCLTGIRTSGYCLLILLLAGCQATPALRPTYDEPVYSVTEIVLNEPLRVRPNRANEYIQYGEVLPYKDITDYYPYCVISLKAISETGLTLQPGTFKVSRVYRDTTMAGHEQIQVAGGDWGFIMSSTYFYLESDEQPGIHALVCERLDESYHASHVSLEEIRLTLDGLFTLGTDVGQ